jgi:cytidyltransferase-like protein
MIISFEDLKHYRHVVGMVDGGFDPLHRGHIENFRAAAQLGVPLLCNVASDNYVSLKHPPLLPEEQRAAIVDAIKYIAYTHINRFTTEVILRELQPRYYIKGKDWEGRLPEEQVRICAELGIEIVYLDTVLDSSTRILERYFAHRAPDFEAQVQAYEDLVFSQQAIRPEHYDDEYFVGDWRDGRNKYSIETRREIEGRNPALIQDVFQPRRVLDVGCGPGALMFFLHELGIDVHGIDFSEHSKVLAPPEVRDQIIISSVDRQCVADNAYDLVICREVFEHLTVLQVRETVRNICKASSRYVYATTRFHPEPVSLLDVTTQDELDPSHITLMTKEMLRVLFVLEGFKRRPDLEDRIDWLHKGRVLVYEKQHPA